jgi:uncharacterized protein YkwD
VLRRPLIRLLTILAATALLAAPADAATRAKRPQAATAGAPVKRTRDRLRAYGAQVVPCPDAGLAPAPGNLARIRAAVLCLHNRVRAAHGLPRLRENVRLRRAATRHSADMVARGYFAHTAPGGSTFVKRILAAHYIAPRAGWFLGENLAWGTSTLGTPAGIMRAWMQSPEHRANVLRRGYREVGLGIVTGVPSDRGAGATYTADFGARR